jgi:hypothetical protein
MRGKIFIGSGWSRILPFCCGNEEKRTKNHWEQRKAYSEFLIETTKELINRKEFVSIWFCLLLRIKKIIVENWESLLFFQWLQNTNKEEVALVDFLHFLYFNLYLIWCADPNSTLNYFILFSNVPQGIE